MQSSSRKPDCYCSLPTTLWRAYKSDRNYGRWFWRCSKFGTEDDMEKCNYFKWADEKNDIIIIDNNNANSRDRGVTNISNNTVNNTNKKSLSPRQSKITLSPQSDVSFIERHLTRQDNRISTQERQNNELNDQLENARKEIEGLKSENNILRRENNLLKREIELTKEEIRYEIELKRRKI
ncbi:12179_t:CDS:2 [Ambispora leptoticha]|uniref:12179_t:CDS:1 n=1 Tax=Ambispora leptoticha TaxID=144679 RepID=A0A9N9FZ29_9GLOM|nr:12179_t:CDS:2 [Ambispora leptoticha]